MLRLLVKFVILLLLASVVSMLISLVLFHQAAVVHYQQTPPEQAKMTAYFINEKLQNIPVDQWKDQLNQIKSLTELPWKLLDERLVVLSEAEKTSLDKNGTVFSFRTKSYLQYIQLGQGKILSIGLLNSPSQWVNWQLVFTNFAIVLLIIILVGVVFLAPIVSSIRLMQKKTDAFKKGDWSVRLPNMGKDVIGELGHRFNEMAEKIEQLFLHQKYIMQAVSHELRTPMARIRFGLEMLSGETNSQQLQNRLDAIDEDLLELDHLVEELLLFQRSESLESSLQLTSFSLSSVVERVIERLSPLYPEVKFSLIKNVKPEQDDVLADQRYIQRAVQNLLHNATHYGKSQVSTTIEILADRPNTVTVIVEDDGKGIEAEHYKFILQPFARLEQSRNRNFGGLGLGLPIVDRIVKAHKGSLSFSKSSLGGLMVSLVLNLEPV